MKIKESKKTKSRLILVGFFLVFIGFIILALKFGILISQNAQEDKSINNFKEKQEIVHDDITSNKEDKEVMRREEENIMDILNLKRDE